MSSNQFSFFQYLPALLVLINDQQAVKAAAPGAEKKAAVLKEFEDAVQAATPLLHSDKYGQLISDTVDFLVKAGKDYEAILAAEPPPPAVAPPTPPAPPTVIVPPPVTPPPPTKDPTAVEYDTLDAAKQARGFYNNVNYLNAVEKADGRYVIWPNITPLTGDKVVFP